MAQPSTRILGLWGLFAGTHLVMSHPGIREKEIQWLGGGKEGQGKYLGLYSAVSFITLSPLVGYYIIKRKAQPLFAQAGQIIVPTKLAWASSFLVAASGASLLGWSIYNPSAKQLVQVPKVRDAPAAAPAPKKAEPAAKDSEFVAVGVHRITRHPTFAGLGLLGLGQAMLATTSTGLVFWGGFPVFYIIGCVHQDYRKKMDLENRKFMEQSSLLPFKAIIDGRNTLKTEELNSTSFLVSTAAVTALYLIRFLRAK